MRIRTGYSFRLAFGHLKEVAERLDEIGWERQPISDRCSTYAFNRWSKLVKDPIYGVELAVIPDMNEERPSPDYWSFFAISKMNDLHSLIGEATQVGDEKKEPRIDIETALKAKGVVKIAGNRTPIDKIKLRGVKDFYIALSPSMPIGLYRAAKAKGISFIASSDNVYTRPSDLEIYRIMLWRFASVQTYPQHIMTDEEWELSLPGSIDKQDVKEALKNRAKVFKQCKAKLEKATLFKPERKKTLLQMCQEGAKKKNVDLKNKVYADRLARELKMIKEKEFEDYFYIIADIVSWAKQRMIVGPARGSSCGSLVCYLLDITAIDPIPYKLIFERFIDITRADLPDIDIDFSDARRQLVFDYVSKKYGREHVARLGTVGTFQPKSALNAAGFALQVPKWKVDKVSDSIIIRSSGDSRALQQLEDTLNDTEAGRELRNEYPQILNAARLEGHSQNASQHAAGIVVTAEPIEKIVAVDRRTYAAMCDKKDAEDLNLLKIDALGLTQLSVFERTLELAGLDYHGFLEKIPLDDQTAFDILNNRQYSGIFQFNGMALQSISKEVRTDKLEDIIAMTALARPGPMASGGTRRWIERRRKEAKIEYPHPLFKPYLEDTLGVVTYQEQVLQIGRNVGDLSWEDVTALRKAMSRSLGKEFFDQYGNRWKANAIKKGINPVVCEKVWDDLCSYGSWAFNRAHAVAYGLVSYYCCWFKAHYPLEFAAATLDSEGVIDRQMNILRELHNEGIGYVPVDVNHSDLRWAIRRDEDGKGSVLVGPLTMIKGVGPKTAHQIVTARKKGEDMSKFEKKLASAKTPIDSIFPVTDAIKTLHPDLTKIKIFTEPTPIREVQCGIKGEFVVIAVAVKIAPKDENEAVNVAKRGGRRIENGPTQSLNLFVKDDTDEIFCKISRYDYEELGKAIYENGRVGKSIYAIKGKCPSDFRMISVKNIRYLGELDQIDLAPERGGQANKDYGDNAGLAEVA